MDREFWLQFRQALLMVVDIIERFKLPELPRTSELRKEAPCRLPAGIPDILLVDAWRGGELLDFIAWSMDTDRL